jgi:flagellar hook-basal body complex protein FliE
MPAINQALNQVQIQPTNITEGINKTQPINNGLPFSSILKESVANQPKINPMEYMMPINDKTTIANANAAFAQAMLEDEINRKYKTNTIDKKELLAQALPSDLSTINQNDKRDYIPPISPFSQNTPPTHTTPADNTLLAQALNQQNPITNPTTAPQPLTAQNVNIEGLRSNKLDITPFQLFIDKALEALEGLSTLEYRVNNLMDQYAQGKVSIEEVSIETTKLSLAVSFATTVISQATQIFKEIQSMQV